MNGTLYLGIGFLLTIAIIGVLVYLIRKHPVDGKNKVISICIGALQAMHILIYLTGILGKISNVNVYAAFIICVVLSLVCLILSIWISIPPSRSRNAIKYLFVLFAIVQVFTVIWMFLLPEGGIPPLIQF